MGGDPRPSLAGSPDFWCSAEERVWEEVRPVSWSWVSGFWVGEALRGGQESVGTRPGVPSKLLGVWRDFSSSMLEVGGPEGRGTEVGETETVGCSCDCYDGGSDTDV